MNVPKPTRHWILFQCCNSVGKNVATSPPNISVALMSYKWGVPRKSCTLLTVSTVIYRVVRDSFRMTELWDYPKYGCPFKRGGMYYYFYNSGLQNQRYVFYSFSGNVPYFIFLFSLMPDDFTCQGKSAST